ncbi:alpha/beta hydrolase [Sporichthya brevicatena]|uniref:Alpha/beta hydrolase n=2 Tax=Sporichthya brevicatena TaxID=171442 RepID=A0ABN1G425_9ACTN
MTAFTYGDGVVAALAQIALIAEESPPADVAGSRAFYRKMARLGGAPPHLDEVRDHSVETPGGPLGLRVYRPGPGPLPALIFLHGGWFFLGDLETHDTLCRQLAAAARCVVIAVDYRRAPEHPCPAAPDDCFDAARWVVDHANDLGVDAAALAIGGDSAGGALALVTARRARDGGGPTFCAQLLFYPVISSGQNSASWRELPDAPIVNADRARFAWSMYLPPGHGAPPADVAPEAIQDLTGLPPTTVITAEYDPLRAEAEEFGARLRDAGVEVAVRRYPGMIHGFVGLAGVIPAGREAIDEVATTLRAAFAATTGATT